MRVLTLTSIQHGQPLSHNKKKQGGLGLFTCDTESDRKRRGSWKGGTEQEGKNVFIEVKGAVCQAQV